MNKQRDVQKLYKRLDHIQHILLRPDRHLGSTREKTLFTWSYDPYNPEAGLKWGDYSYSPALVKMVDEILTNSIDFSKTPEGSHVNKIDVNVNRITGMISIEDNGGIPIVPFEGYNDGLLPDMLFGELFTSSNYNEDDEELSNSDSAGQNGEGASLVNVFSKVFTVLTGDGKKIYERTWKNNMNKDYSLPAVIKNSKSYRGTKVSFIPEYHRFRMTTMTSDNWLMVMRRIYEAAACNPNIEFTLNGKEIRMNHFRDFSNMFGCEAVEETSDWKIGIYKSDNFTHHSFVNSVHTWSGGPHVEYVLDKIIEFARPKLKRAYGCDYKPGVIRGVIGLVLVCNIKTPRFDSQTKEKMTTSVSEFGTKWEPTQTFLQKAASSIVKWMGSYHETLVNQEETEALESQEREIKKIKFHQIEKYEPATSTDRSKCTLFLTEGDSAKAPIMAARNTSIHGVFPLKGKILNVIAATKSDLVKSNEIKAIIAIMVGLNVKGGVDFEKLRYHNIVISTDADADGMHIRGLVAALFMRLWPEFIKQGRLKFLVSPVVIAKKGKTKQEFFNEREFETHLKETGITYDRVKYLKGLGSNDTESFKEYLNNSEQYHIPFVYDDSADAMIDLAFNQKRADDRKPLFKELTMNQIED